MQRGTRNSLSAMCAMAASLFAVLGVLALDIFVPVADSPAAILFPPATPPEEAFHTIIAAGGLPLNERRLVLWGGVVWIAAAGEPGFLDRVTRLGALAVINPLALGGCLLRDPR